MKYDLTLFFKLDKITEIMDHCDLTDGSSKIFCEVFNITIEANDGWFLSPAVVEVLENSFISNGIVHKISPTEDNFLCGIYDAVHDVFYNFTPKNKKIRMFSDGKNFAYFDTKNEVKKENYQKAYKYFIFNDKQAKNDKFVCNISDWLIYAKEDENEDCK